MKLITYCATLLVVFTINGAYSQLIWNGINFDGHTHGKHCREIGEYCQNHWDCCSNSCLTYSYRCVRGQAELNPAPPLTNNELLTVQTANNIEELVNRFGGNDDDTPTQQPINNVGGTQSGCYPAGAGCFSHNHCCSLRCGSQHFCY